MNPNRSLVVWSRNRGSLTFPERDEDSIPASAFDCLKDAVSLRFQVGQNFA
jgi:hypothetical protein